MARCAGSRAVRLRGVDVTLRTTTLGAKDAEYRIPAKVDSTATIRAVQRMPRSESRIVNLAGEEFLVDMEFLVASGDAPSIVDGDPNPEIDDPDGVTYEVRVVGPAKGGLRRLLCRQTG